jgi:micrococcal nuclease
MKKIKFITLIFLIVAFVITKSSQLIIRKNNAEIIHEKSVTDFYNQKYDALVTKVVDGDTIKIRFINVIPENCSVEETVRFIGVNTPELNIHNNKPKEYFASEASDFTNECLSGRNIKLRFDSVSNLRDKYNRLIAYIYHEDFLFNQILIEQGYANYYPNFKFEYDYMNLFKNAEMYAKKNHKGKWN